MTMKKLQNYIIISVLFFCFQTNATNYNNDIRLPFYQSEKYLLLKDKGIPLKIGYLKRIKGPKCLTNFPIHQGQEQIIVLKPTKNTIINNIIEKIEFPLAKSKFYNKTDKLYKNVYVLAKIRIYTIENDLPGKEIFSSEPIAFLMHKKGFISVNIAKKEIVLPKEGLCFGIEMVGKVNENGETVEDKKVHARPFLTSQPSDDYSAVTYYRTNRNDNQVEYYSINDGMKRIPDYNCSVQDYNLAIGLVFRNP